MPVFQIGWLADFADADNWARPYMYSLGDFSYYQHVEADPNYNATHVDNLIDEGIRTPDGPEREAIYKELQRLYHDLAPSLPTVQALGRRWQRYWVQGWYYNALYPGMYFYHMWKGYTPPPPPPPVTASILTGMGVPISGSFIDPGPKTPAAGFLVFIQQSPDNVTWTNIAAAVTDKSGWVNASVIPPLGTSYYRLNFTGYIVDYAGLNPKYYEPLIAKQNATLSSMIGTSIKVEAKTLEDILTDALTPMATKDDLDSLSSSLTMLLYASIIIAIIAIIIAIVALIKKKS